MTLRRHNQLILWGFLSAYFGVMGGLASLSFVEFGPIAVQYVFIPAFIVGCMLVAIAELATLPANSLRLWERR